MSTRLFASRQLFIWAHRPACLQAHSLQRRLVELLHTPGFLRHNKTLHRFARGGLTFAAPARLPRRPNPACAADLMGYISSRKSPSGTATSLACHPGPIERRVLRSCSGPDGPAMERPNPYAA
jgi:hypothetical protein